MFLIHKNFIYFSSCSNSQQNNIFQRLSLESENLLRSNNKFRSNSYQPKTKNYSTIYEKSNNNNFIVSNEKLDKFNIEAIKSTKSFSKPPTVYFFLLFFFSFIFLIISDFYLH